MSLFLHTYPSTTTIYSVIQFPIMFAHLCMSTCRWETLEVLAPNVFLFQTHHCNTFNLYRIMANTFNCHVSAVNIRIKEVAKGVKMILMRLNGRIQQEILKVLSQINSFYFWERKLKGKVDVGKWAGSPVTASLVDDQKPF